MDSSLLSLFLFLLLAAASHASNDPIFDKNYFITYGNDHIMTLQHGIMQLSLDQSSGAGFESKASFGSGFFQMKMKIPAKDSTGVVTTFYLTSHTDNHDELDFEFLGNSTRPQLQTNVYSNGPGGREQRVSLWFDPTADFHSYKILWNQQQIVFYVDDIPIRVFKNNTENGVSYPSQPMQVVGTIWEADWESNGRKPNWADAPFNAQYQGFEIDGCRAQQAPIPPQCKYYSPNYWWNGDKYSKLNPDEQKAYENVRQKFLDYDYCADRQRYPQRPAECQSNQ